MTSLSVNAAESVLVAVTSHNQVYALSLGSSSPLTVKGDDMRPLSSSFHWPQPITGMNVCARKPIVVTCGADRTVRVRQAGRGRLKAEGRRLQAGKRREGGREDEAYD